MHGNDDSVAKSGFRKAMLDRSVFNYTWAHEHVVDLTNSGFLSKHKQLPVKLMLLQQAHLMPYLRAGK